jgi:hypothetical protein
MKGIKKGGYFAANSNVLVDVFEDFDFEVTVIVATHSVPPVSPVTVTGLLAAEEDKLVVNTTVLSDFFLTVTSTVTPSLGNAEVIFAFKS